MTSSLIAEHRLIALKISENFGQLASDNIQKPAQAMKDGKYVGATLGIGVSAWDAVTRSGDALFQGIADRKIEDASVMGDIGNIVSSTAGAVFNTVTLQPKKVIQNVISGVSSAFQAPQSLITQSGRAATGTDYNLAA